VNSQNPSKQERGLYSRIISRRIVFLVIMAVVLFLIAGYSVALGVASISLAEVYGVILNLIPGVNFAEYSSFVEGVVLHIRLPRILLGLVTGLALGSSGTVMQSLLKNPLASPYTLGISAGAALGAGISIVLGSSIFGQDLVVRYSSWMIIIGAFLMGLFTIFLINIISSLKKGGAATLILAGIALSYLFSAGVSLLKYLSDHDELAELTVWLMGGLNRAGWLDVIVLTPILIFSLVIIMRLAWDINTLNAGEEVAANLGIDVRAVRKRGSVVVALLASSVVAFTGVIGFIGLVAPHICRMFLGNDNRFLIVASGIMGAIILLIADTIARLIISPAELPVGIITSLFGAPFFLYMLIKRKKEYF